MGQVVHMSVIRCINSGAESLTIRGEVVLLTEEQKRKNKLISFCFKINEKIFIVSFNMKLKL